MNSKPLSALLLPSLLLSFLAARPAAAQEAATPASPAGKSRWAIETELVQPWIPEVGIIRVRATRTLWGSPGGVRGDLLAGAWVRPGIVHDVVYVIYEYAVAVGYRQYLWKGLHAEASLEGGQAWGTNRFDGLDYRTPVLILNANVGYRFDLGGGRPGSPAWYVIPQFGVLTGLTWLDDSINDIGPRGGKPDTFLQGSLFVGLSF